eukprot:c2659_g1_i1.p1 GENE.c2659_g1_i1~~c2659_g1_i1.p1  ORF type:complete len:297 (-),score=42.36 c2659_g1_i1:118-1008(-)
MGDLPHLSEPTIFASRPNFKLHSHMFPSEDVECEEVLRQNAERAAELVLGAEENSFAVIDDEYALYSEFGSFQKLGQSIGSPTRPEWQKICIQHSVCIHNIYGNCAYAQNCYYHHLEDFKKPDLLFRTELCRYGMECVNRPRCCFAHHKKERRTPEQNVRDALIRNHIHLQTQSPTFPHVQQQPQQLAQVSPVQPQPQFMSHQQLQQQIYSVPQPLVPQGMSATTVSHLISPILSMPTAATGSNIPFNLNNLNNLNQPTYSISSVIPFFETLSVSSSSLASPSSSSSSSTFCSADL